MQNQPKQISAGEFKAKCLKLMDNVHETHRGIIITKHGIPIAKLVPYEKERQPLFGIQESAMVIKGDIISAIEVDWNANQ